MERVGIGIRVMPEWRVAQFRLRGVLIEELYEGGAAAQAGLRPTLQIGVKEVLLGDLIIGVNQVPVKSAIDLYRAFDQLQPGTEVKIKIIREGKEEIVPMRLQVIQ